MIFTNNLANNASPSSNERPKPIDRRYEPEEIIDAAVRRVLGNSSAKPTATPGTDSIRDMVVNTLQVGGISTEGKSDSQMLDEYMDLVRKGAQAAQATAANSHAAGDFAGYDLNQPAGNAPAAPVVAGNSGQKAAAGEFDGYDLNKL
ncbi:hypothetical protein [Comamonas antarctica]|uniref:Uncharacterized protein n=1 Tax=Comamonas antarctica TaxID=2743470 RepID=A0A6N1X138_9BURK|nr:hypothetical protein [Comamonas antarctica]QKV52033.1 hypothetical protein HUK68_03460 [Comamonas antarctica]